VELFVVCLEAGPIDVHIDLCGSNIGVSQNLLNNAEVRSVFDQISGKGVP
jgi:hypothetical protein